jgi:hypothetical protein
MLRLLVILVGCLSSGGVCCAQQALKAVLFDSAGEFVGSAVWQADNVAAQAEIQIPDLGMTVKLEWRRNADKSLPASHTIELAFRLPADFPHGGIANVPGILMKPGETDQGVPLNALSRKIGDNLFLIGPTNADAENIQRNMQLMRDRTWFDVPIVYSDGKRAILAVEKGGTPIPVALYFLRRLPSALRPEARLGTRMVKILIRGSTHTRDWPWAPAIQS